MSAAPGEPNSPELYDLYIRGRHLATYTDAEDALHWWWTTACDRCRRSPKEHCCRVQRRGQGEPWTA
jgi:hypothetical protein